MQNLSDKGLISQINLKGDTFEQNPRRRQEIMGRPIADALYKSIFGESIHITRYEKSDDFILDSKFAIDVELEFPNGFILNGQEKFLSPRYAKYTSITVEYMQNSHDWGIGSASLDSFIL